LLEQRSRTAMALSSQCGGAPKSGTMHSSKGRGGGMTQHKLTHQLPTQTCVQASV
jgi:hypothetical protein